MPKGLSAPIVVDLYPSTAVGLASLLQGEGDVAKWAPAARIKEVRLGGCKRIRPNSHIVVKAGSYVGASGPGKVKLLVIVVAEKWVNGLVLPAVSRPTARRTATISCPGELAYKLSLIHI